MWSLKKITAMVLGILIMPTQLPSVQAEMFLNYESIELEKLSGQQDFPQLAENIQTIVALANQVLAEKPDSVTYKTVLPPSGDPHDYVSIAKYWWPDVGGQTYISRDGQTNPERDNLSRYDNTRLNKITNNIHKLSLAYYVTGKEQYVTKAVEFIKVFFINPDTRMNPNLNFAQGIPGKNLGRGVGIIDTVCLIQMTDDLRMLEKSSLFSKADDQAIKQWFSSYVDWLQRSENGIKESQGMNNHGVWYDAQLSAYALFSGHRDLAAQIVRETTVRRIDQQIKPDGGMSRELVRTKSMNYTSYTLRAFITIARVGDQVGVNIWDYSNSDGRSMKKAIDYFIPYAEGSAQWQHEQIVPYHDSAFARYLYLAEVHYGTHEYDQAIRQLLAHQKLSNSISN